MLEVAGARHLDIQEGRHPCLDLAGDALIPNDTQLSQEKSLIILTGQMCSCLVQNICLLAKIYFAYNLLNFILQFSKFFDKLNPV